MTVKRIYLRGFVVFSFLSILNLAQNDLLTEYENKFFTLDFARNSYEMADINEYFFTTFPHEDPTLGNVIYDRLKWVNNDMIALKDREGLFGFIRYRNDGENFDSFRFTTKSFFNLNEETGKILFVFKGEFPSEKGIWPAWWLNGSRQDEWLYKNRMETVEDKILDEYSGLGKFYDTPSPVNCTDWPSAGEIDIIETINGDNIIHNTIHTCPQMCDSEWNDDGVVINCANPKSKDPNSGCSGRPYKVDSPAGTFACLWEKSSISFYYWDPQADVRFDGGPLDESPKPGIWDKTNLKNRVKLIETGNECNDRIHQVWQCESCEGFDRCEFKNLKMIFNITLCGIWAGNRFDETENSFNNCGKYVVGDGLKHIDNQFIKIEYVSVSSCE